MQRTLVLALVAIAGVSSMSMNQEQAASQHFEVQAKGGKGGGGKGGGGSGNDAPNFISGNPPGSPDFTLKLHGKACHQRVSSSEELEGSCTSIGWAPVNPPACTDGGCGRFVGSKEACEDPDNECLTGTGLQRCVAPGERCRPTDTVIDVPRFTSRTFVNEGGPAVTGSGIDDIDGQLEEGDGCPPVKVYYYKETGNGQKYQQKNNDYSEYDKASLQGWSVGGRFRDC